MWVKTQLDLTKSDNIADPTSATIITGSIGKQTPTSLANVIVMKQLKCVTLEEDSYFSGKAQFSALLQGCKLLDYVYGKVPHFHLPKALLPSSMINSF